MDNAFNSATSMDGAFDMAPSFLAIIVDHEDPAVPVLAMTLTLGVFANQFGSEEMLDMICNSVREAYFNAECMEQTTVSSLPSGIN